MNIQMQMSGICILVLLFYFYKRQGNLGLYIGKLFMRALYTAFICLALDIISIILIVNQDIIPAWIVKTECKAYLISLVFIGYVALVYANADIKSLVKADKFSRRLVVAVVGIVILICALPIHIYYDGVYDVYTYGPACYATYAGALILIFATLFKLIFQGKSMNPKRRNAILLWISIWIVAALVQFFNSRLLLVGFASAVGMVILFFELENPEFYIDRSSGAYNNYALEEFIRQKYTLGEDGCGVLLSFENLNEKNIPLARMDVVMTEIVQFLQQLSGAVIFKVSSRELFVLFDQPESLENACDIIRSRFEQSWAGGNEKNPDELPVVLRPLYLMLPSIMIAGSANEMLDLLKYYRLRFINISQSDTLVLDESSVNQKRSREELLEIIRRAIKEDRIEVFWLNAKVCVQRGF